MKKVRIYNFYESGGDNSKEYSPLITIDPSIKNKSKFGENVDIIIFNLKSGKTIQKRFCSNGFPLVASTKKNGELRISN